MAEYRTIDYRCPYCGHTYSVRMYDVIDADTEPDLKERCRSGDIFHVSCPHCRREYMIQYPLLYIDRGLRFALLVSEKETAPLSRLGRPLAEQGYRLRRCTSLQEFTEKIAVFEDGMDDIMVELTKYDTFIEYVDNRKGTPEDITSIEYQRTENEVMKINVRADDKSMSFLIPVSMMQEEMDASPDLYRVREEDFPVVDSAWVISLFAPEDGTA